MHCEIRTPERALFEGDAKMIVASSPRGDFAIMADHAPLLATLGHGPVRVETEEGEQAFACLGGTLRVAEGRVTILAESAMPVAEIDLSSIRDQLAQLPSDEEGTSNPQREALLALERIKEKHG